MQIQIKSLTISYFSLQLVLNMALTSLWAALPSAAQAENAEDILTRHRNALGGMATLAKVPSVQFQGTMKHGEYTRTFSWSMLEPSFFKEVTTGNQLSETLASDGNQVWSSLFNGVLVGVSGTERDVCNVSALVLTRAYLRYQELDFTLSDPSFDPNGNRWSLVVSGKGHSPVTLSFDGASYQLLSAASAVGNSHVELSFEEPKKSGDVYFPTKITRKITRDQVADEQIYLVKDIDRKTRLEETAFERPNSSSGKIRFPLDLAQVDINADYRRSTHHLLIEATVNEKETGKFLLDTAAYATVIDTSLITKLGLPTLDSVVATGIGGSEILKLHPVGSIKVGAAEVVDTVVTATALGPISDALGVPIVGILGVDLFDRMVVGIDYRAGVVRLSDPSRYTDPGHGESLPIDPYGRIQVLINGNKVVQLMPDTGNGSALNFAPSLIEQQNLVPPPERRLSARTLAGIGGSISSYQAVLDSVQLGSFIVPRVVATFHEQNVGAMSGDHGTSLLGNQMLDRFSVTFDFPNRQMVLIAGPDLQKPYPYDRSGLTFKEGSLEIVGIHPNLAPQFQVGDILVGIKSQPATQANPWITDRIAILSAFQNDPNSRFSVKIRRVKKELERELVLVEPF